MSTARPHGGGDSGHSASIQIDPPAQSVVPSATGTPFPLPAHRPNYNDDDEDSDEDGPLLGASSTTRGGPGPRHHQLVDQDETGQGRRSSERAPFLYRLHDWLADHGTKLKSFSSNLRSAKAPLAGWRKVLKRAFTILGVVLLLGLLGLSGWLLYDCVAVCSVNDSDSVTLQYSFHPDQYKNFYFHLDHDTVGDITVSQYNSPYGGDGGDEVMIFVNARGSSGEIARAVTLGTITNPDDSSLEANVYMSTDEYERERVFRRGCVDINVRIVFPQNMTHFDSFKVHNRNRGDVDVNFGAYVNPDSRSFPGQPAPAGAGVAMDRLDVKTNNGRVFFTNTVVKEDLKVIAAQGSIIGQITVDKRVETESKDTHLTIFSTSADLDLKVSSETYANILVSSNFSGHVVLKSWTNMSQLYVYSKDKSFVRQAKTLQTLTGYFPYPNGTEPTAYLPRIEISGLHASLNR
ncbi:hypothetical protein KI688_009069 [Linnemannia hyalina]|uniref:Adhesin domain-containing protein n=1 Tax=Linnemannia hyalina TaxID=64524 RepID=A0A9P8BUU5_9FUNG|nr:hypothetical protein KI688_009069 [Linnemannia hyalina]